eukprot:TRINITY_DN3550_c0_g1_i1.p1 TRINITY_DN3550_c0_g1~~TRINITY_DN3550_c0_g1_i1.p1  ORF type:complete len:547 (+),score=169.49 TRINITY_DN3550_c0_g1_i1:82-1722(+)
MSTPARPPNPHPYKLLNRPQKQAFFQDLQEVLGQIVEDDVVFEFVASMLENFRQPSHIIHELSDIIGDRSASFVVNWTFDRLKQIAADPNLKNMKEYTWDDFEVSLTKVIEKYTSGAEINWTAENKELKRNAIPLVSGPTSLPMEDPDHPKYPPLLIVNALVEWMNVTKFPGDHPEETLMYTNKEFREYFLDTLYLMGYMLSMLTATGQEEGEEDSSGEVAEIGDTDEPSEDKEEEQEGDIDQTIFVESLAPGISEIVIAFVTATTHVIRNTKANDGDHLYKKYKQMAAGEEDQVESPVQIGTEMISRSTPPFAEVLGRSSACRQMLREHPNYKFCAELGNKAFEDLHMLYDLSSVIEEEILVIHVGEKKGYKVKIDGCSNNQLLGMALAATLIQSEAKEEELLQGTRPPRRIIDLLAGKGPQAIGRTQYGHPFSFSVWTAVKPDGSVPSGMAGASHWIWADGCPKQIPVWHDHETNQKIRVLLLNKVPFQRKFTPVRMFDQLASQATITHTLQKEEVEAYLKRIGSSPTEERQIATDDHKNGRVK